MVFFLGGCFSSILCAGARVFNPHQPKEAVVRVFNPHQPKAAGVRAGDDARAGSPHHGLG